MGRTSEGRSEQACPVCGEHDLAVDALPRIDVMGVQPYSDLLGMGDLRTPDAPGIVCLACGSRWPDLEAFALGAGGVEERGAPGAGDRSPG